MKIKKMMISWFRLHITATYTSAAYKWATFALRVIAIIHDIFSQERHLSKHINAIMLCIHRCKIKSRRDGEKRSVIDK